MDTTEPLQEGTMEEVLDSECEELELGGWKEVEVLVLAVFFANGLCSFPDSPRSLKISEVHIRQSPTPPKRDTILRSG